MSDEEETARLKKEVGDLKDAVNSLVQIWKTQAGINKYVIATDRAIITAIDKIGEYVEAKALREEIRRIISEISKNVQSMQDETKTIEGFKA